ncbi:unnamed protein product [Vitrella brassicaformis CCMP3155]|uniref:Mitotic-spindle organizing protein 1 n=1 Tax=Vitrella brassicaformis (strain CCMP3155) TaxID=1169540 RepID=A0A0G4F5B2_VITBC|nr:unnamed protein product [Vitrella brassicaformis CCMP3155]|eukprot:CEM07487.1 unnamed protein product [Vitrella brassicaformis CCMP3155]
MSDSASRDTDEVMDILHEMATLLNTGLSRDELTILVCLCEQGVNPEALARIVLELRREAAALKAAKERGPAGQQQHKERTV